MTIQVEFTGDIVHIYDGDGTRAVEDTLIVTAMQWAHLVAAIRLPPPEGSDGHPLVPAFAAAFLCPSCQGRGTDRDGCADCDTCNGTGLSITEKDTQ